MPEIAEYVLGLLPPGRHAEIDAELARSAELRVEAQFWRQHFSGLDHEFEPAAPPNGAFGAIEKRLFGTGETARNWWASLSVWRGFAAVAVLLLVVAVGILSYDMATPPEGGDTFVASLQAENSSIRFLATYDARTHDVRLTATSGEAVPDRDLELWFIKGQDAPISLGVLPLATGLVVPIPPELVDDVDAGTVLAITLEPLGGAPGGIPSGPVVAAGELTRV